MGWHSRRVCGRYVSTEDPDQLRLMYEADTIDVPVLPPNYNVAPTQPVYVVDEMSGPRNIRVVNWGLIPSWAKDASIASKLINARSDTIWEKPSFRSAIRTSRCLIPANGWFEWQTTDDSKRPYLYERTDHELVSMGGILEAWRDPATGAWRRTCAIITTDANLEVAKVHDRMPVIIEKSDWATWLNPHNGATSDTAKLIENLMRPAAADVVRGREVSKAINSVKNNAPEFLLPVGTNEIS